MKFSNFEAQALQEVEMACVKGGKRQKIAVAVCACCCAGNPDGTENTDEFVARNSA